MHTYIYIFIHVYKQKFNRRKEWLESRNMHVGKYLAECFVYSWYSVLLSFSFLSSLCPDTDLYLNQLYVLEPTTLEVAIFSSPSWCQVGGTTDFVCKLRVTSPFLGAAKTRSSAEMRSLSSPWAHCRSCGWSGMRVGQSNQEPGGHFFRVEHMHPRDLSLETDDGEQVVIRDQNLAPHKHYNRTVCLKIQEKLDSGCWKPSKFSNKKRENPDGIWCQQILDLSKTEFGVEFSLCFGKESFLSFIFGQEASLTRVGVSGNTWLWKEVWNSPGAALKASRPARADTHLTTFISFHLSPSR